MVDALSFVPGGYQADHGLGLGGIIDVADPPPAHRRLARLRAVRPARRLGDAGGAADLEAVLRGGGAAELGRQDAAVLHQQLAAALARLLGLPGAALLPRDDPRHRRRVPARLGRPPERARDQLRDERHPGRLAHLFSSRHPRLDAAAAGRRHVRAHLVDRVRRAARSRHPLRRHGQRRSTRAPWASPRAPSSTFRFGPGCGSTAASTTKAAASRQQRAGVARPPVGRGERRQRRRIRRADRELRRHVERLRHRRSDGLREPGRAVPGRHVLAVRQAPHDHAADAAADLHVRRLPGRAGELHAHPTSRADPRLLAPLSG